MVHEVNTDSGRKTLECSKCKIRKSFETFDSQNEAKFKKVHATCGAYIQGRNYVPQAKRL